MKCDLCRVFGTGYPSLATMTVSDWYEQHQKYGALPDRGIAKPPSGMKCWDVWAASSFHLHNQKPEQTVWQKSPRQCHSPLKQIAASEQGHFWISPTMPWKQQPHSKTKNPLITMCHAGPCAAKKRETEQNSHKRATPYMSYKVTRSRPKLEGRPHFEGGKGT